MQNAFERVGRRESIPSQSGSLSPSVQSSGYTGFSYPMLTPSPSLGPESYEMPRGKVGLRTLNHPVDCHMEVVFVHGLLGDSNLSWTFDSDKAMFWPEWLLDDPSFCNMRFHMYGYHEPPVSNRAPVSKLRERGLALCSELELNNEIRTSVQVRIVGAMHINLQNVDGNDF